MALFNNLVMTNKGIDLYAKVQAGTQLTFTKVTIGDGELPAGTELRELEALINEKKQMTLNSIIVDGGQVIIRSTLTNEGVQQSFYVRELGLFASDPDVGEILYAVANAGDHADYLPAYGGAEYIEQILDIVTSIGTASSVTAQINQSLVFATRLEMDEHDHSGVTGKGKRILSKDVNYLITAKLVTDPPSAYPEGLSYFNVSTGNEGWPTGFGLVETVRYGGITRTRQVYMMHTNGSDQWYYRHGNSDNTWTPWKMPFWRDGSVWMTGPLSFDTYKRLSVVGTMLQLNDEADSAVVTAKNASYYCANCYYDGSSWQRVNTGAPAYRVRVNPAAGISVYKASSGANPISSWDLLNNVPAMLADGSVPMTGRLKFTDNDAYVERIVDVGHLVCASKNGAGIVCGKTNTNLVSNAYYDNGYKRIDITKKAVRLQVTDDGDITISEAPVTGDNSITWGTPKKLLNEGNRQLVTGEVTVNANSSNSFSITNNDFAISVSCKNMGGAGTEVYCGYLPNVDYYYVINYGGEGPKVTVYNNTQAQEAFSFRFYRAT